MINCYLAGPIFTERDRMFLSYLAEGIRGLWPELNLYVPHENASINDKTKSATSKQIYDGDMARLKNTDLLIAVVSGDMPPIGTTCEVGIFSQMQESDPTKHMICLYDDCRNVKDAVDSEAKMEAFRADFAESQWHYINLFLIGCIKSHGKLVGTSTELFDTIEKEREFYRNFNKKEPEESSIDE